MCLVAAVLVPMIYFGVQPIAAPFFPNYRFQTMAASLLGSSVSQHPWIFNTGAMLTGVASLLAAFGLYSAGRARGGGALLCWLVGLGAASIGVSSFKAGMFPLPDPRHTSWGWLVIAMIATPFLLLLLVWMDRGMRGLRNYLIVSDMFLVALVPLMSGLIHFSWLGSGTLQRLFAAVVFLPIGVAGYFFLRRTRTSAAVMTAD